MGFELVLSVGWKWIVECVDVVVIFGKIWVLWCEVFKKYIFVGELDLVIGEEEFVDG